MSSSLTIFNIANILLLVSIVYKLFPPKAINDLYGYRTSRSMKSQEAWDFANQRSSDFMLKMSLVSAMIFNPALIIFPNEKTLLVGSGLVVVVLIIGHIFIERKLRKIFDKNGNRIA